MIARRSLLKALPFAGLAISAPAGAAALAVSTSATASPDERIEAAVETIRAAMVEIHGEECDVIRNGNQLVSVMAPPKPRIVEFAGPGLYEVEIAKGKRPIYRVERSAAHDHLTAGRCFRLTPEHATHLPVQYMFEGDLRLALVRKI